MGSTPVMGSLLPRDGSGGSRSAPVPAAVAPKQRFASAALRSYTCKLHPVTRSMGTSKWEQDADLEAGHKKQQGVVYGDIGTCPLYVFAGIFANEALPRTEENFVGAASLIIWTVTALALVKYAVFVLMADDNGQGGSFALFAQLRRQGLLTSNKIEAAQPGDSVASASSQQGSTGGTAAAAAAAADVSAVEATDGPPHDWRQRFLSSNGMQHALRAMVVLAIGLIMGDGVLTPAVSVTSSVEGLERAAPGISQSTIVGVSCAIISGLFLVQRFGTAKIGLAFSPIMVAFFVYNSAIGVYNIIQLTNGAILKALSPHYWFAFLLRNGPVGWRALSGVLLSATGVEALFADVGHFSRASIRLGFMAVVFPSLLCMYLGQVENVFFESLPAGGGVFWSAFILATLSAITASQALISARLMVLTLIVTLCFRTSARLVNAYGLAVICDMLLTTAFMSLILLTEWRKHWLLPAAFLAVFGAIEGTLLSASVLKIPKGGWFSLALAAAYGYVMASWFWGSKAKASYFQRTQQTLAQFLKAGGHPSPPLSGVQHPPPHQPPHYAIGKEKQHELRWQSSGSGSSGGGGRDMAVSASKPQATAAAVLQQPAAQQALPGVGLYYSEHIRGVPHTLTRLERLLVQQLGSPGFYHVIARYGYAQRKQQGEDFVRDLMRHIQVLLYRALKYKLARNDAAAPLEKRHSMSAAVTAVVDATVGDLYGEGHRSMAVTQRAVTNWQMSRSIAGRLNLRRDSTRWRSEPQLQSVVLLLLKQQRPTGAAALLQRTDSRRTAAGSSSASGSSEPAQIAHATASAPIHVTAVAVAATVVGPQQPQPTDEHAFETEMHGWASQMLKELAKLAAPGDAAALEPLSRLAAELVLAATAAQQGSRAHVVGRSHGIASNPQGFMQWLRRYTLELGFLFLSKNTDQDMGIACGIPEDKLLEVGLRYRL